MKAITGHRYKLTFKFIGIGESTKGDIYDAGEIFEYSEFIDKEHGGSFVAEFDGARISLDVANAVEKENNGKPMFKEIK